MNKLFSFLLLITAFVSCNAEKETVVTVHSNNVQEGMKIQIALPDTVYRSVFDATGNARFVFPQGQKSVYASIRYGYVWTPVYLESGKDFNMSVDIDLKQNKADRTFEGEGAEKNIYLQENHWETAPDFTLSEENFFASLQEMEKKLTANLESSGFGKDFTRLEKKRLHYYVYSSIFTYATMHGFYTKDKSYRPSSKVYDVMRKSLHEDVELLGISEYMKNWKEYINIMSKEYAGKCQPVEMLEKRLDIIMENMHDPVMVETFVDIYTMDYIRQNGVDNFGNIIRIYNTKVKSERKLAAFKKAYGLWFELSKGQESPSFECMDINGNMVSLASLAGKYVYIDIWATWCGPCRGELPHLQQLEKDYEGRNIVFVSLSCDQDKKAWESMVKRMKLGGMQLILGKDKHFMDAYMVRGIPRFILIDREGRILSANMTRPSDPLTRKSFDALEGI